MINVDVVITWVDGSDPIWAAKREYYQAREDAPLHDNAINPHRWVCSDELNYCLCSIANNAPWVRRVWIVTDGQVPDITALPAAFAAKISIVDHRDIFSGHIDALPTFNSLAIETMLWRIKGLSEHFLYFNDDVFLTAPAEIGDFFAANGPVLRGSWADYSALLACTDSRDDASLLNHYSQINSATIIGYSAEHIFDSAHTVHPMQRSIMADLFEVHRPAFLANAAHRFRSTQQFLPQSLYNHACLASGQATILGTCDYLHVPVGAFDTWSAEAVHAYLGSAERHMVKFLCINDLPEVERNFPDARIWIEEAIGGVFDQA